MSTPTALNDLIDRQTSSTERLVQLILGFLKAQLIMNSVASEHRPDLSDTSKMGLSTLFKMSKQKIPSRFPYTSPIFTILVGQEEDVVSAHEDVLCRSPVLKRMRRGPFSESIQKTIKVPDETREEFAVLLEFLYTGSVVLMSLEDPDDPSHLELMSRAYIIADKYGLPELQAKIVSEMPPFMSSRAQQSFSTLRIGSTKILLIDNLLSPPVFPSSEISEFPKITVLLIYHLYYYFLLGFIYEKIIHII